jgi:rare lipoprotein A
LLKNPVCGALALGLLAVAPASAETVRASWYGGGHERLNSRAADGSRFNPRGLTCAHRSLPFGTRLRIAYRGRSVVVRVTDRGPDRRTGRALDLSRGAADALGLTRVGVGTVNIERL